MVPRVPITHRDEEYDSLVFDVLRDMQLRHFWYIGRHRFIFHALKHYMAQIPARDRGLRAIDVGGGCGGWVDYLSRRLPGAFDELALADSSLKALELAKPILNPKAKRYQIDLLNSGWTNRWDLIFLLDVVEHIPPDQKVFDEAMKILSPGGLLIVTAPALKFFWSYNDEMVHHVRRYSRRDYRQLGESAGLNVLLTRYFMFFLSPLLLLSRMKTVDVKNMKPEEISAYIAKTHRVPAIPLNQVMTAIFSLETPIGHWIPFPWGTSILGVFQKPI
ncbi:MAG: methyltransferase domain-containing protein [Burkholderiales bacterium]|nr:methyltransferase domain-containing protein [Phycisphaerae bacterium]